MPISATSELAQFLDSRVELVARHWVERAFSQPLLAEHAEGAFSLQIAPTIHSLIASLRGQAITSPTRDVRREAFGEGISPQRALAEVDALRDAMLALADGAGVAVTLPEFSAIGGFFSELILDRIQGAGTRLRDSAAELRTVTDALPVLVSYVQADERYGLVNKAYEDWFGIPRGQLVGRTLRDVIGDAAYQALRPQIVRGLAGERFSFEQYGVPYRLGGTRDVRVEFIPHRNSAGECDGYVALLQDITAQRSLLAEREALLARAQTARAEAQAERVRQHDLFMQAPVAIAILHGPEHVFTFANPAYRRLVNGRDVVGKTLHDALPDVRGQGFDLLLDRVVRTGETYFGNEVAIRLDHHAANEHLTLNFVYSPKRNSDGEIDGVLMSGSDVTEQVRARYRVEALASELRQSEERLRQVVEASGAGLWSVDIATGQVDANARARELVGKGPTGAYTLESGLRAMPVEEDRVLVTAAIEAACAGHDRGRYFVEFRSGGRDDVPLRWLESRGQITFDAVGGAQRLSGALIDITDRKRVDAERDAVRALEVRWRLAAEQASRAKDEFMAILGHELRNPLAPILTVLELMRMRAETALIAERDLIERQVQHMARLVDDLLDVARITSGKLELKRERLDVADILRRAVEIAMPLVEQRGHTLIVRVPSEGWTVDGDAARLTQLFSNLLTNAVKYTDEAGEITVSAQRDGGELAVSVRDSGRGISAEMLPRVFEMFAQEPQNIDRAQGGLGLGLAIVRSLAELHSGRVLAKSAGLGKGSTFTLHLPLCEPMPQKTPSPAVDESPQARRELLEVLLVDDNEDAAELLSAALELLGCVVRVAYDSAGALEAVAASEPRVALLDIGLPGIDGYALARLLRERAPEIRLVALTGYGQAEDRRRAHEAGFDRHLVKPVSIPRVLAVLHELTA